MAKTFRQRVAQAEAAARAEELRLQQEVIVTIPSPSNPCACSGINLGKTLVFVLESISVVCSRINLSTIDSFQDLFYKGSLSHFTRLG